MSRGRAAGDAFEALRARVLRGAGATSPEARQAAASTGPEGLPPAAAVVIEKVRAHAYRVTDADIDGLRAAGLSEDAIFELVIAASLGVAQRRLDLAMAAIDAVDAGKKGAR